MPGTPPPDPADHAQDFSERYTEDLDVVAGQAMIDLGVPAGQPPASPLGGRGAGAPVAAGRQLVRVARLTGAAPAMAAGPVVHPRLRSAPKGHGRATPRADRPCDGPGFASCAAQGHG